MKNEKYNLIYVQDNSKPVSALGYRYVTTLYNGPIIYIDDLVTLVEARGKGYAGILFNYVVEIAKKENIETIHLDSNHARYDAHRLYLNKKMKILAHHFRLEVLEIEN
jgi:GNAT superfamily N-acetyltransferase